MELVANNPMVSEFHPRPEASMTPAPGTLGKKVNILILEDDESLSELFADQLRQHFGRRVHVDRAADPFEAIDMMVEKFYDLVILDWQLPVYNGGQTLRLLERAFAFEPGLPIKWDFKQVPVVVLSSAKKSECHFNRSVHFKPSGFISKQHSLDEIMQSLSQVIHELINKEKQSEAI